MTSRPFTPKSASSRSVQFSLPSSVEPYSQFTPKFRHDTTKSEHENKELMMTVRRSQSGDTEFRFPIGVNDTQKLINSYLTNSDDSKDISLPVCKKKAPEFPKFENTPVIQHTDSNRNLKSSYAHQMTNPPNKPIPITNVSVNINKSINREKSTTEEQTNPHNIVDRKMVHLVGFVEQVLRWHQILKDVDICVLYNVLGEFSSVINGTYAMEKVIFIRGSNGTILECSFFEVDRALPSIEKGQFVGCLGQIIGPKKMRLYTIQILQETEPTNTQRAIYLSQRMAHELNNRRFS